MGSLYKGGYKYSNGGYDTPATHITFAPETSGLTSRNVNDAIVELASVVKNAVAQWTPHNYVHVKTADQDGMAFLKESLIDASRAKGGFHLMYLTTGASHYIGITSTADDSKCSFTLHSVEQPSSFYYGYFDSMNTTTGEFYMYQVNGNGKNLFEDESFSI